MTVLSNLEISSGVILFIRQEIAQSKLTLKSDVPVLDGDTLQIYGKYRSNGSTEVISDIDGYTVNAADDFKDDTATFQTSGVAIHDILYIKEGAHKGYYKIWKIDSETQLSVCRQLIVADIDGYTTISTDDFKDDSTDAFADVSVGDIIYIEEGSDAGWYVVGAKDSNNQLSLTGLTATASESNLKYSIFKKVTFTSTTSLDYEIWKALIFKGALTITNFEKVKTIASIAETDEANKIRPNITFENHYIELIVGRLINQYCSFINTQESTGVVTLYPASPDIQQGPQWDDPNGNNNDIMYDDIDEGVASPDGYYIHGHYGGQDPGEGYKGNITNHSLSSSYHYYITGCDIYIHSRSTTGAVMYCYLKKGSDQNSYSKADASPWDWETKKMTEVGSFIWWHKDYTEEDLNDFTFELYVAAGDIDIDAIEFRFSYQYYPNLDKTNSKPSNVQFNGDKTLYEIFNWAALYALKVWYLTPIYEFKFNDGVIDSGVDIGATSNLANIDGQRQVETIDRVDLLGGYVGGNQLSSSYGSGTHIVKDTYAQILDQITLDNLAQAIYTQRALYPKTVAADYAEPEYGYIQIGEEITIIGNSLRFSRSEDYICTSNTQFKLRGERLNLGENGVIIYSELYLDDALVFDRPQMEQAKLSQENSQLIGQVGEAAAGGEANVGANIGTDGVGVYVGKNGVTLQFRHVAPASTKVTTTLNGNDIDIDIVPSQIDHGSLGGLGDDDHSIYLLIDGSRAMTGPLDMSTNYIEIQEISDPDAPLYGCKFYLDDSDHKLKYRNYTQIKTLFTASSEVNHDSTTGFVANEHIDHTSVSISAGMGLTGGGTIAATRTISLSHLGLESLVDPNADRVLFWDESANALKWLTMGTNLTIDDVTLNATSGSTPEPVIHPLMWGGALGFAGQFATTLNCWVFASLFSDTNSIVAYSFYVKDGGTFTVRMAHSGNADNSGKTASGKVYITYRTTSESLDYDINGANWDIEAGNNAVLLFDDYGSTITVGDGDYVNVVWEKDDNAGGASGSMYIHGIVLIRN